MSLEGKGRPLASGLLHFGVVTPRMPRRFASERACCYQFHSLAHQDLCIPHPIILRNREEIAFVCLFALLWTTSS